MSTRVPQTFIPLPATATAARPSPTPGFPLADLIYHARRYQVTSEFRGISQNLIDRFGMVQTDAVIPTDPDWRTITLGYVAKLRAEGLALQAPVDVPDEIKRSDDHVRAAGLEMVQSSDAFTTGIDMRDASAFQREREHLSAAGVELQKANADVNAVGLQYGVVPAVASPTPFRPSPLSKTSGIGQPAYGGGIRLTVNSVRTAAFLNPNLRPSVGSFYVLADLTIQNESNELASYSWTYISAKDVDAYEHSSESPFLGFPNGLLYGDLRPGDKIRGAVAFELPRTTKQLTILLVPHPYQGDHETLEVTVPVT